MQVDLPKHRIGFTVSLYLKGSKVVPSVRVVVLGECVELHNSGHGGKLC